MATADAIAITPAWLTAQRWFRAKSRAIRGTAVVDELPLSATARLVVAEAAYADGGPADRYLVPLVGSAEPADGSGAWRALVGAMADGAEIHGRHGRLRCSATPALAELLPSPHEAIDALVERRLGVEQSNTSVVLGERLILKLFRLLEPGRNPDIEIGGFLTARGFDGTPALAGSATYLSAGGEACDVAILQAFVPSRGDGWSAMLGLLAHDPAAGITAAGEIGELTRRLHAALAADDLDPSFAPRAAATSETGAWRAAAERELAAAVAALDGGQHDALVALGPTIRARFADAFGRASGAARVMRIHGDYHLGQLLATEHGFLVIDFEGEPARPLADRRAHASPMRDVAGMLRSLDYAARSAAAGAHAAGFDPDAWLDQARSAFLGAYGAIGPSEAALVEAFELEKACYEVRYEANNRPAWRWLPLAAVARLAAPILRGA
jgi:trehalose synthase-fused probable maltokinase